MPHRPIAKAVLLALADDCHDDGSTAYTSRATLVREVEVSAGTIDAHLRRLATVGLIVEQAPPTQHRPRTWRLDLARICSLADSQAVATLSDSDQQVVATLRTGQPMLPLGLGSQAAVTLRPPEWQIGNPDTQRLATERIERKNKEQEQRARAATAPNGDNFHVIKKIAIELLAATGLRSGDLVEAVKRRCVELQIDHGRDAAVPCQVVGRACGWAEIQALKAVRRAG
jgi:hypothetical protein